mmetsp:Transcript_10975/g.46104  ORF Transcript_10975/g.46104 Transcript_10975/m.46104 type:complete len:367 (-) Transcript_10975:748-1848(-)
MRLNRIRGAPRRVSGYKRAPVGRIASYVLASARGDFTQKRFFDHTHRARVGKLLVLRHVVHEVRDVVERELGAFALRVLRAQRGDARVHGSKHLSSRTRLERVHRPEHVVQLDDRVPVALLHPRASYLLEQTLARVVVRRGEAPQRVRHTLRGELRELRVRHLRQTVERGGGQRHELGGVPRGPQDVRDALRAEHVRRVVARAHDSLAERIARLARHDAAHRRDGPDDVRELHAFEPGDAARGEDVLGERGRRLGGNAVRRVPVVAVVHDDGSVPGFPVVFVFLEHRQRPHRVGDALRDERVAFRRRSQSVADGPLQRLRGFPHQSIERFVRQQSPGAAVHLRERPHRVGQVLRRKRGAVERGDFA